MKDIATLKFDLKALSQAMCLTEAETVAYFTDGRRVSFILERRISREVIKGDISTSEGASYDLLADDGTKWEVRSITRQGVYFCPSYMVGSGRKFDEKGFLAKLDEIDGYLLAHVEEFPEVSVWQVSSEKILAWYKRGVLGSTTKVSAVKAIDLLMNE